MPFIPYSSAFILNQLPQSAAAYGVDKLKANATSPMTLYFTSGGVAEGSTDLVVPFANGTMDKSAVESYIARERLTNPTLTTDAGADGTADSYTITAVNSSSVPTIVSGQRVTGTASADVASVLIQQVIPIARGETINVSVLCNELTLSGTFAGVLQVEWKPNADGSGVTIASLPLSTSTTLAFTTTGTKTLSNIYAPPLALSALVSFGVNLGSNTNTFAMNFTNASVKKVVAFAINDRLNSGTGAADSNVAVGFTSSLEAGITAKFNVDSTEQAQKVEIASSSSTNGALVTNTTSLDCAVGEVITETVLCKSTATISKCNIKIDWYTSGLGYLSSSIATDVVGTGIYNAITIIGTAPATAAKYKVSVRVKSTASGDLPIAYFKNLYVYRSNVSANITRWTDQSGNANHATQGTYANMPRVLNNGIWDVDASGKVSPIYDGSDDVLNKTGLSLSNIYSWSYVGNQLVAGVDKRMFSMTTEDPATDTNILSYGSANIFSFGERYPVSLTASVNNSAPYTTQNIVSTVRSSTTLMDIWRNGTKGSTQTTATKTVTMTRIYVGGNASPANQQISEIIIFNAPLTDAQRQKLERNQGKRFNITVS